MKEANMFIPIEVQGWIRHLLHFLGVSIVAKGGMDQANIDVFVGVAINLISLIWYITYKIIERRKEKQD